MISLNRNFLNVKLNERKLQETSSERLRIKRRTSKLQLLRSSLLILLEVPDNSVIEVGHWSGPCYSLQRSHCVLRRLTTMRCTMLHHRLVCFSHIAWRSRWPPTLKPSRFLASSQSTQRNKCLIRLGLASSFYGYSPGKRDNRNFSISLEKKIRRKFPTHCLGTFRSANHFETSNQYDPAREVLLKGKAQYS